MSVSKFTKGRQQPSPEEIRVALGPVYPLWERLTHFIHTHYQIQGKWSTWGPAELGWGLRYNWKSRSLVALYPQQGGFVAQVVLDRDSVVREVTRVEPDGGGMSRCHLTGA